MTGIYMHEVSKHVECPTCGKTTLEVGRCIPLPPFPFPEDVQEWEACCYECNSVGDGSTEDEAIRNVRRQQSS